MKRFPWLAFLAFAIAASLHANPQAKIALVNGTLINPGTGKVVPNALVIIDGDRISAVGDQAAAISTKDAQIVDCKGKFILPGYIDTHVHFFQSGDIFTRPDAVDLTSVRPYKDELAWIERNLRDTFGRYIRCGITSVVDVGGPMSNFRLRKLAKSIAKAPRVAVAGPLISSVSRPQLDLGDPPIVKIDTPEQGREMVRKLAPENPDYVKIWYIVPPAQPRTYRAEAWRRRIAITRVWPIRRRTRGDLPAHCSRGHRGKPRAQAAGGGARHRARGRARRGRRRRRSPRP